MFIMPCERALWKVLPSIRKEIAIYLIREKKISRKKVARILCLTEPALCQYLNNKRGSIKFSKSQKKSIKIVAEQLLKEPVTKGIFMKNICYLCKAVRGCCK